jgi:hypothetical protein
MSDTALAQILARLAALETVVAVGTRVTDCRVSRPPDEEPRLADDCRPRQPRRVRSGLTRAPPDDELREPVVDPANDRRLTKRRVAEREGCSTRTVDRRVADGSLPSPDIINNRCFWWLSVLQRHERAQSTTRTPPNTGKPRPRNETAQPPGS